MSDERVETRVRLVGRGNATSPESIEDLKKRAKELEKLSRKKPSRRFGELLSGASEEPAVEEDEAKTPPRGPRPGLVHPVQREVYGRLGADDSVILKG